MTIFHSFRPWLKRGQMRFLGRIFKLAAKGFFEADEPTWAAAIAYFSLLALFPLLLACGSMASYFFNPSSNHEKRDGGERKVSPLVILSAAKIASVKGLNARLSTVSILV